MRWSRFRGLLFAPEKRAKRVKPGFPCCTLAACAQTGRISCQLNYPTAQTAPSVAAKPLPNAMPRWRGPACKPQTPRKHRPFATSLIAAKPVKPCDGGVFWAFYLLLFLQQIRAFCTREQALNQPGNLCAAAERLAFVLPSHTKRQKAQCKQAPGHRRFRSCFDSSQARQTVRWRRSQPSGFALFEWAAKSGKGKIARPAFCDWLSVPE